MQKPFTFSRLFDNSIKKTAFIFIVATILPILLSWKSLTYEPTSFVQLKIVAGKVYIGPLRPSGPRSRASYWPFSLIIDGKKVEYLCCQFNKEARALYRGKLAKVWVDKSHRIYQLEIDDKLVVTYKNQKNKFLASQQKNATDAFIFLILASLFFYIAQVAEPQTLLKSENRY